MPRAEPGPSRAARIGAPATSAAGAVIGRSLTCGGSARDVRRFDVTTRPRRGRLAAGPAPGGGGACRRRSKARMTVPVATPPERDAAGEAARLLALDTYAVLDTPPERGFDDIVRVAATLCGAPTALVSLVSNDRQWFKARVGFGLAETPLDHSICAHALGRTATLVIPDCTDDPRTRDNPLVVGPPFIRFYAGAPLATADGLALGTLCVIDTAPRPDGLGTAQVAGLEALARQVMAQLELRRLIAAQDAVIARQRAAEIEAARRHAEARGLASVVRQSTEIVVVTDPEGRIRFVNPAGRRLTGTARAAAAGAHDGVAAALDWVDARDLPTVRDELLPALRRAGTWSGVLRLRDEAGGAVPVLCTVFPLHDRDGVLTGYGTVARDHRDAAARAARRGALLELGDRLRDMDEADAMPALAAAIVGRTLGCDRVGTVRLASGATPPGVQRDTPPGVRDDTPPGVRDEWCAAGSRGLAGRPHPRDHAALAAAFERGEVVTIEDARDDARVAHLAATLEAVDARASLDLPLHEAGRLVGVVFLDSARPRTWSADEIGFVADVAERTRATVERRRAEHALRDRAATLETRIEERTRERDRVWRATGDLMGTAGLDGFLKEVNPAWSRLLDRTEAELLAEPLLTLIDPADHAHSAEALRVLAAGQPVAGFVTRLLRPGGERRIMMWDAAPDGDVFHLVGRDITALRAVEEQLRQSQKMEAVGQLTGGIAHDFNNLLTGIIGSLDLLRLRAGQGRVDEIGRYVDAAQGAAARAAALTHRLLAFSRRQTLDPRPTDVNRLLAGFEDLIRRTVGPGIAVEIASALDLWPVCVDGGQLENAVLNLCINARDAMPGGGRLLIATANERVDADAARNRALPPGDYVAVRVRDEGTGMSPEIASRAFDPFFTTKPIGQGTGLGLSMVYGFARQSGGEVRIVSAVGCGTTVHLTLPRDEHGLLDPGLAPAAARDAVAPTDATLLVVDDEPTVRALVTEVLRDFGYAAIEAGDGAAALAALRGGTPIDLLVTDLGLPGGMNGRELADAARSIRPGLRVLFITGYAENALGDGALDDPRVQVLPKPFAMDDLAGHVRALLALG